VQLCLVQYLILSEPLTFLLVKSGISVCHKLEDEIKVLMSM
jgi:hypothetical protein